MDIVGSKLGEPIAVGSVIADRYEVIDTLGKGGMGAVVKVFDRSLDEEIVALKLLYGSLVDDEVLLSRFRNEVLIVRQLSHPNIVQLYDFGQTGTGSFFISMEYVDGQNLTSLIRSGSKNRPTFEQSLKILYEIALGLEHAHSKNVVHRDVKPDNIIIAKDGSVKLTDFGLARMLTMDKGFTNTGEAVGTPYYMAPEQIQGETVDGRADIYSFAILAFELVLGRRPFENSDWFQLAAMHLQQPFPKVSTKENGIPKWFEEFLHKAAAKKKSDRYRNFGEVIAILKDRIERRPTAWKQLPSMLSGNNVRQRKEKVASRRKVRLARKLASYFFFGLVSAAAALLLQQFLR